MLKRIITSIVALIIFIPILVFSNTWLFPAAMSICAVIGIFEMLGCIGQRKNLFITLPLCGVAAFFPLYFRYEYITGHGVYGAFTLSLSIIFIMALYVFGVAVFANKSFPANDCGLVIATSIYIISAFTALVYIRDFIKGGEYIYLLTFIGAWMTDIFAYFTGRFLGKHKLIPTVSPKKTVEGAIGGIVFCIGATVGFGFVVETFFNPEGIIHANYLVLAVSGLFISVVSQIGDLVMSLIKRLYNIKDYGKLFPGHGGILDRFDSVIAVTLILAFITTYFNLLA